MSTPPYHHYEEYQKRKATLLELPQFGITPYPHSFHPTLSIEELQRRYEHHPLPDSEQASQGKSDRVIIGGRLTLFRAMGTNAFGKLQEGLGSVQIMFNKLHTTVSGLMHWEGTPLKFLEKKLDLGDILGVTGYLFRTHKGELTVYVTEVVFLAKALLPLPDKHAGLVDKEIRYRKRWIDLISHHDVLSVFHMRSKIIQTIRETLWKEGFIEVETPILQQTYGGAEARPFTSHINALHHDAYLRISLEISLKKLIVGGMTKIFELGKIFRNEGIDKTHNPEFTMIEAYAIYWDYHDLIAFMERLLETISLQLFGTTELVFQDPVTQETIPLSLRSPWKKLSMIESIQEFAGFDVSSSSDEGLRKQLLQHCSFPPQEVERASRGSLIAMLFDELVSTKLIQPTHILDHPIETTPLCKPHRDPEHNGLVERFESFILGRELCNAYTELNDPLIQRDLLVEQDQQRKQGKEEAHPLDEEFIESICQGMPPTGGIGIGIDRLVMLFTNAHSIRDVILFPMMKPKDED